MMKNRDNMTDNRFAWVLFFALFVAGLSGCTASGSDCSQDSDCPVNQQCSSGGGVFFGGGICLAAMSDNRPDVGGNASEGNNDVGDTQDVDETIADTDVVNDATVNDASVDDATVNDASVDDASVDGDVDASVDADTGDAEQSYSLKIVFVNTPSDPTKSRNAEFQYRCEDEAGVAKSCTYECYIKADYGEPGVAVDGLNFEQWFACDSSLGFETAWEGNYEFSVRATDDKNQVAEKFFSWQKMYVQWSSVSAGSSQTCAIDLEDRLWCWGTSSNGALGLGVPSASKSPTPVVSGESWKSVSVGKDHVCGISKEMKLYCWGDNRKKQVGIEGAAQYRQPELNRTVEGRWDSVSAGTSHTCGTSNNKLFCWGTGLGILGLDTMVASVPTVVPAKNREVWSYVSVNEDHSCVIDLEQGLYCWGFNDDGKVGVGSLEPVRSPTAVKYADEEHIRAVSAGYNHTCGIFGESLYCWGKGDMGQLGQGGFDDANRPEKIGFEGPFQISSGTLHTCAVNKQNQVYCWGDGFYGQLGINQKKVNIAKPAHVDENGGADWLSVSAGEYHTCGIRGKDELWCWGRNNSFQLGLDGGAGERLIPNKLRVHLN